MADDHYKWEIVQQKVATLVSPFNIQVLLSRLPNEQKFSEFFLFKKPLSVTSIKQQLTFKATIIPREKDKFLLSPMKKGLEPIEEDQILLLQFMLDETRYIAQSSYLATMPSGNLLISPIDPRFNKRYSLNEYVSVYAIPPKLLLLLVEERLSVNRQIWDGPVNKVESILFAELIKPKQGNGEDPIPHITKHFSAMKSKMRDFSRGGCCLHIPKSHWNKQPNLKLLYVSWALPSLFGEAVFNAFLSVRNIRATDNDYIFHCMFLENLPDQVFDNVNNFANFKD